MKLSLVSLHTPDRLELPGLLFEPVHKTNKIALWLHGMGDSGIFYQPSHINALAKSLTDKGIALLAFNNRGAHYSKKLRIIDETLPEDDRTYFQGGTYYERIADCVHDIDGAVDFIRKLNYKELYLIGHSTGANKICAYHARVKNSPFTRYVLSGPGDDSGLFFSELGERKFKLALGFAQRAIKEEKSLKIMPKYSGMYPYSAQAAADIINPDGDYNTFPYFEATSKRLGKKPLFLEYKTIDKPMLVIFGEEDEYTYTAGGTKQALNLLKTHTNRNIRAECGFVSVQGADHSFHGYEQEFGNQVAQWLNK